jgi:hypothetical protein
MSHKQSFFLILNNPKTIYNGRNEDNYFVKMQSEIRTIPRPPLKIGSKSFVDTYSPF